METQIANVSIFFVILNLIDRFSNNSEGAVRLGMFFMSNGGGIMSEFGVGAIFDGFGASKTFLVYNQ